jgi:hypothetical protein
MGDPVMKAWILKFSVWVIFSVGLLWMLAVLKRDWWDHHFGFLLSVSMLGAWPICYGLIKFNTVMAGFGFFKGLLLIVGSVSEGILSLMRRFTEAVSNGWISFTDAFERASRSIVLCGLSIAGLILLILFLDLLVNGIGKPKPMGNMGGKNRNKRTIRKESQGQFLPQDRIPYHLRSAFYADGQLWRGYHGTSTAVALEIFRTGQVIPGVNDSFWVTPEFKYAADRASGKDSSGGLILVVRFAPGVNFKDEGSHGYSIKLNGNNGTGYFNSPSGRVEFIGLLWPDGTVYMEQ